MFMKYFESIISKVKVIPFVTKELINVEKYLQKTRAQILNVLNPKIGSLQEN